MLSKLIVVVVGMRTVSCSRCGHKGNCSRSLWTCKTFIVVVVVIRGIACCHCGHKKLVVIVVVVKGIEYDRFEHVKS